jgi:hypothetical protein
VPPGSRCSADEATRTAAGRACSPGIGIDPIGERAVSPIERRPTARESRVPGADQAATLSGAMRTHCEQAGTAHRPA